MNEELIETLAHFAHSVWANWTWYMLSHNDAEHQDRWRRQAHTNYEALPDAEQESDRAIAREWLDEIGYDDLAAALRAERERVAELETEWQQEHTERICLEERVKYLGTRLESEIDAAMEAARKEETC